MRRLNPLQLICAQCQVRIAFGLGREAFRLQPPRSAARCIGRKPSTALAAALGLG